MDINNLKQKLEQELAELEAELANIGNKHTFNANGGKPVDWEARPGDFSTDNADETELGDKMEEYEENTAVLKNLEIKYNEVRSALNKINEGNYGICEVCSNQIEEDRLIANPSAKTCKEHMNG